VGHAGGDYIYDLYNIYKTLMTQHLLTFLILTPVAASLLGLFVPAGYKKTFQYGALAVSFIQVLLLVLIFQSYSNETTTFRLAEKVSWITLDMGTWGFLQAEYFVALDGMSLAMVSLSVMIMLIAVISSFTIDKNIKGYFVLLLILNGAIIGSFCALDLLLFYLFFEFMLLPMYFLIGIWGGPKREYASIKFFLYTLLGSIFILIAIIALYLSAKNPTSTDQQLIHTFNILHLTDPNNFIAGSMLHPDSTWTLGIYSARSWVFLLLFVGFAIKLPMVPFHTWLPDAHVEAPTAISVILAALLLKIGAYGLARLAFPVFPDAVVEFSWFIGFMGLVSIIYGALNALASKDLKRLIAYSSVSHMGFVLLGLASGTTEGISGAVYQMVSHGIIAAMLFLLAGVLYDRTNDRQIDHYSGLSSKLPAYGAFVLIAFFASMGLPGFSGFIAEIMIFLGAFKSQSANQLIPSWMAIVATSGLILGAAYYLWTIQRMFFGKFSVKIPDVTLPDLDQREYIMLLPLAFIALFFGIFPQPLLDIINPFAEQLAETLTRFSTTLKP